MPTYDYQCDGCDHTFEEFQSMMDEPLKKCPQCGKKRLRRLLGTGAAIIFKGAGFYQTDYRSEGYKKAAKADEAKSPTAPTAATDNKPTNVTSGNSGTQDSAPAKTPAKKAKSST